MLATLVGLVVGALLLAEAAVTTRFVRRHAVPADLAITLEDCERAARDASDFRHGLSRTQRREVAWAVWKGRSVGDPMLTPAATSAAYAATLKARVSIARPQWLAAMAGVFWGALSASRLVNEHGWLAQTANVAILLASVWLVRVTVVGPLRRAERAQLAQRLNLALVAGRSSDRAESAADS